jgi:uncharacterized protein
MSARDLKKNFGGFVMEMHKERRLATEASMPNPAVLGLAGFGGSLLIWQFYNLGWMGIVPVISMGFFFGGLTQMIAGFLELRAGNNFGFCAFGSYGAFWVSMSAMFFYMTMGGAVLPIEVGTPYLGYGWFLFTWIIFTALLLFPALKHHNVLGAIFAILLLGLIMLAVDAFWISPTVRAIGACFLIVCALVSWYLMLHLLAAEVGFELPLNLRRITISYATEPHTGAGGRPLGQTGHAASAQASSPSGPTSV